MKSTGLKNRPKLRQMFKKFEGKAMLFMTQQQKMHKWHTIKT